MYSVNRIKSAYRRARQTEASLVKHIWRIGHPNGRSRPIFIVGCNRSGTTMLTFQLGKSWHVTPINENNPKAFEKFHLKNRDDIIRLLDDGHGPALLLKPVLDTYLARDFLAWHEDARVVFLYRHFNDVVNSLLKYTKKRAGSSKASEIARWLSSGFEQFRATQLPEQSKEPLRSLWYSGMSESSAAALFWLFQSQLYFDLSLDQESRATVIRYENVVSNPQHELRVLCQFLGIPYQGQMARGIHSNSIRRDPAPPISEAIRSVCEGLLHRLDTHLPEH